LPTRIWMRFRQASPFHRSREPKIIRGSENADSTDKGLTGRGGVSNGSEANALLAQGWRSNGVSASLRRQAKLPGPALPIVCLAPA
jgi:hypothetical protein